MKHQEVIEKTAFLPPWIQIYYETNKWYLTALLSVLSLANHSCVWPALSGPAACHSAFEKKKKVGETKQQRCKTQRRIVRSVGPRWPIDWCICTTMEWLWITVATCVLTSRSVKGKCWNKQSTCEAVCLLFIVTTASEMGLLCFSAYCGACNVTW